MLALGIIPTSFGTYPDRPLTSYQVAAGGERMNRMDVTDGVQLEQLLAEKIDLIVVSEIFASDARDKINEQVQAYQRIAPLIALPEDVADAFNILTNALALDEARGAARLDAFNDLIAAFPKRSGTPRIAARTARRTRDDRHLHRRHSGCDAHAQDRSRPSRHPIRHRHTRLLRSNQRRATGLGDW